MGALTLPGVDVSMPSSVARDMSQWFTPVPLAERMARSLGRPAGERAKTALEPSAGAGALVRALLSCGPRIARIDAVELDPMHAEGLRALGDRVSVECGDYLTRSAPAQRYDIGFANPPYENDLDARFVAKLMDECDFVIVLVRAVFFNGLGRHERVWSRVEADEWRIVGVSHLVRRPSFLLGGVEQSGAQADFVVIKMRRTEATLPGDLLRDGRSYVEWWQ